MPKIQFKRREQRLDLVRDLFHIKKFSEEEKSIRATMRTVVFTARHLHLGLAVKALNNDWISDIGLLPFEGPEKQFQVTIYFDEDFETYVDGKRTERE